MNKHTSVFLAIIAMLPAGVGLTGCGSSSTSRPPAGKSTRLVGLDSMAEASNVYVFDVGAAGTLTPVIGSPFDLGTIPGGTSLSYPTSLLVHPSKPWLYAAASGHIEAFYLDAAGKPVVIDRVEPEGSPTYPGCTAITPDGRFLYVGNSDKYVGVYRIDQTTGALTLVENFETGLGTTQYVTATNGVLYVGDNSSGWAVAALAIQSTGRLSSLNTLTLSAALGGPQVDRTGNYLYVPRFRGITVYSLGEDGALGSSLGTTATTGGFVQRLVLTADNKHLYAGDGMNGPHGFAINSDGTLTELDGSPYSTNVTQYADDMATDASNGFLYSNGTSSGTDHVYAFTRDASTGELTDLSSGNPVDAATGYALAVVN